MLCVKTYGSQIFLNVRALILLSLAVTHYHSSDLLSNLHIIKYLCIHMHKFSIVCEESIILNFVYKLMAPVGFIRLTTAVWYLDLLLYH